MAKLKLYLRVEFHWAHKCPAHNPNMGLLPATKNCGLRMHRECRKRFPRHRLQRKPLASDSGMHHGTCVTHVPWCMSGSLTHGGGENVLGISGACAIRNFTYLNTGPWAKNLPCYNETTLWFWIFQLLLGSLLPTWFNFNPSMDESSPAW